METDFILNGAAHGSVSQKWLAAGADAGMFRPWIGKDGKTYVSLFAGNDDNGEPKYNTVHLANAGATLRKNEWQKVDEQVVKAARTRMRLVNDFRQAGLVVNLPNAWGTSVFQYERQSDISAARISMDGLTPGDNDRPVYDIVNLPLPVISKQVTMNSRAIAISRNGNTPLDTANLELAAIKVAEQAEALVAGTYGTYSFGGGTVYGLTNFPSRITGAFLNHTVSGWTPTMMYNSVIEMIDASTRSLHYGPWKLYYSTGLLRPMMQQFSLYDSRSLQNVIGQLPGIQSVGMLDYLTGNQLLLVQQDASTARIVMGMDITTVQWGSGNGLEENFLVMAMIVPQMKTDINSTCGIVHYTGNATTT